LWLLLLWIEGAGSCGVLYLQHTSSLLLLAVKPAFPVCCHEYIHTSNAVTLFLHWIASIACLLGCVVHPCRKISAARVLSS
jgi:hypothetical protein